MLAMALGLALLWVPKGDLHLFLCSPHTPARDHFFRYYTTVAEWLPYFICVGLLLFSKIGNGVFASACMILSGLTTQLFKHIINAPRPVTWFASMFEDIELPLVEGVRMNTWYSFPSGHTTSFFALAFMLCIILTKESSPVTNRKSQIVLQLFLVFLAALGGYSRIYLSQHFAMDVLGGIIVGILISILCYAVLHRYEDKKWYNHRLFTKK